jgi:phospholipid/cholesterol/gamma-HCH transport system substrate-binding protein
MDERVLQARVGIVVVSSLLLTAILIVLFGDAPSFFKTGKTIHVKFPSAPGVTEGTPVRKSGILIGRVQKVDFAKDSSDVIVTLKIDEGRELWKHEICRISSDSLLGDKSLEFVRGNEPASNERIKDGDPPYAGISPAEPLEALAGLQGELTKTLQSMTGAGNEVRRLANRMNTMFGQTDDQQLKRVWGKAEDALTSVDKAMTQVNNLLERDELREKLQQSLDQLPMAIQETQETMKVVREAAARADRNLRNLEGLTGPLGERGADIVDQVETSVAQFEEVMSQLAQFTKQINSEEGSLGQFINNPDLYNNVNKTVIRVERLAKDLRPIMNDVRVISYTLSRDPSRIIFNRGDNTKYPNFKIEAPHSWREQLKPPSDWREPF